MARSNVITEADKAKKEPVFVLVKNHAWIDGGNHHFIEKGAEFKESEDADMISFLFRSGAKLERKA